MGKHWVRQQVKRNEVQDFVDSVIHWITENRQKAGIIAASACGVLLLAAIFLYSYRAKHNAAWDKLSMIYSYAYNNQQDNALKEVESLHADHPGSPAAGYAMLFASDMLFTRKQYDESIKYSSRLFSQGQPQNLMPMALSSQALALEASGKCGEALPLQERFLQTYPDNFLAPQVHLSLARCQVQQGQTDLAKATFQKIVLQYPDTYWAGWAAERLKAATGGT